MSVFANGLEVSGKATPNKTIAAMPDVCLSPPPPPAGPVPIPYPNFGMASDTTDGCTSVFVKGKEAGKKNASKYSKITGNEPATNSFGAGVISHKITGALKFAAYSFDVIFEGGGAERFTDLTTTNHMNNPNGGVNASVAGLTPPEPPSESDCQALSAKNEYFRENVNAECGPEVANNVNQNHTVSHGFYRSGAVGNAPFTGVSCSNQLASVFSNSLSRPIDTRRNTGRFVQVQRDDETVRHVRMDICEACTQPIGGLQAHAELNILNDIGRRFGNGPGGTVVLSINWRSGGSQMPPEPCTNCQNSIKCMCEAGCIAIYICDENDQPVDRCQNPYETGD
ncbi:DUF4150 domain-containing protein [Tabrizicola sp.]|uniref:DUF4150 domain-containing protein n=1 Tax=Tabrizicola sp. TaxID=2005166 RepID=UPI0035B27B37